MKNRETINQLLKDLRNTYIEYSGLLTMIHELSITQNEANQISIINRLISRTEVLTKTQAKQVKQLKQVMELNKQDEEETKQDMEEIKAELYNYQRPPGNNPNKPRAKRTINQEEAKDLALQLVSRKIVKKTK